MAIPMLDPANPLAELLRRDDRYDVEAYVFVSEALQVAQQYLHANRAELADEAELIDGDLEGEEVERHVTGQQLCEALRRYALDQYGLLAKSVLNHWGLRSTGDFGEIVFNLIDIGKMRKSDEDRREDFDDVYDFNVLLDGPVFSPSDVPADAADDD